MRPTPKLVRSIICADQLLITYAILQDNYFNTSNTFKDNYTLNLKKITPAIPKTWACKILLSFFTFSVFSHTSKYYHKAQTHNLIALKLGTCEKGVYMAHLGSKFDSNASKNGWVVTIIQKMTPLCCHAYRVNNLCYEAENWLMDFLNIEPQVW